MTYTNAIYTNPDNTSIQVDINGVTSFVPCAPGNSDYARIQELVAAGDLTIAPHQVPLPSPITQVTMRQARLALLSAGLLDAVESAVASAARAVQIEWEYATVVARGSALVQELAASLSLSDQQVGQLFEDANKL